MVDEKPQHPYRDPVDLALMIASVPWGAPVQELDDIGMDIRLQLMDRGFEDAPRAEVIDAVVSVLHACDVVDSKMASLRGLVRPVVAIVAGLGVMATTLTSPAAVVASPHAPPRRPRPAPRRRLLRPRC
jgi:hypothetical protein